MINDHKPLILAVDDEATNLQILKQTLGNQYRMKFAKSGKLALELVDKELPNLILLDVMMPEMTGFEVCSKLKEDPTTARIPVIFVTALSEEFDEARGFELGGVDYITKPISPAITRARVKTHLSLVSATELKSAYVELMQRLGQAAEYKDNETGQHIARMSRYCFVLAKACGLPEAYAEDLMLAAPMHDIGKVGIADSILLKPGRLDAEEYEVMKQHAELGANILADSDSKLVKLAYLMAMEHHEKFDGSGYPKGLKGEEISLEGRICALADVFDALTSKRPYKEAWPIEKALAFIHSESGKHFDPKLVELLDENLPEILKIKAQYD
ncbi:MULTISPECIES: HD domain-containing phosphohydrolase [Pseudoalteromonas]|uniref:Two-component system response regulator n=1 Tax=Pseudoalteromonas piscicida TaxID=43662 RepID=A0AAQ2EQI6_PSEO7|nr:MULTISPECIES: HD domain-containing phosphohydrolase [Pseudoalteromonas]AUJ72508.1 Cyclic di-GMP phosphodiesterase response regulator RpfG [Pseudoalteromonas sp. NC201]KJY89328.1 chemotaxis protein CheY [Pseudoalteromonas piscicida]MCF7515420.1 response regulator [Pseudoalteromonas sp. L7]MCF7527401.1 response regulator [Pseudoalteromonas sp. L23]MCG7555959.1 response regulator [Pseudoalteromonas sp. Of11M-6]